METLRLDHRDLRDGEPSPRKGFAMNGIHQAATGHRPQPQRHPLANPKVLLYSHDTFGLGHLRRNLAIASHLLQRNRPFAARLLTGSPVAASWPMPAGLEVQPLPPVIKTGAEEYAARDRSTSFASVKLRREQLILESVIDYRPDIFLIDHAPAGMKGELLEALAFIRSELPETRIVLGLRDILDSPQTVCQLWRDEGIYRLLDSTYDHILVYGSRHLFDAVGEYRMPPAVAAKASYCGYIVESGAGVAAATVQASRNDGSASRPPVILVTTGGGGDGFPLMHAYLRALNAMPHHAVESLLVTGPLMDIEQRRALEQAAARRPDIRIISQTTELTELIRHADLVVAMCGYNTTAEILAARKPAILAPRAAPRAEQRLRANLIGKLGLAWVVRPEEDLIVRLGGLLQSFLAGERPEQPEWNRVDLAGVRRVGDALDELLERSAFAIEAAA